MSQFSKLSFEFSVKKRALLEALLDEEGVSSARYQRILRRQQDGPAPLSFAQLRLWFLDQLEPGNPAYNMPAAVHFAGLLDIAALKQSLNEIVQRHESIRTTFTLVEQQPAQVVVASLMVELPLIDLENLSKVERDAEAKRLINEVSLQSFDLARGPLFTTILLRFSAQEQVFLLVMHHIISDGWSIKIFVDEMTELYQSFSTGKTPSLPELPIQYTDFAQWQRQWLQGEVLEAELSYWKQQLGKTLPVLQLPTDYPRPAFQTNRGAKQRYVLCKSLNEDLKAFCQREGVTTFMMLLAIFDLLLYRYSGQDDILVGSPIANRNRVDIENLIGYFVNTLVLRANIQSQESFQQFLKQVHSICLGAYAHQDVPFEPLLDYLRPVRDMSHTPLFQVMLVLQNVPSAAMELPALQVTRLVIDGSTAKFDLLLAFVEKEEGLVGLLEYNTDLFEETTIVRMLKHFENLLTAAIADPEVCIADLPLLSEQERSQLILEWNNTQSKYSKHCCIHQLFEAQVEITPAAIAVTYQDNSITYQELNYRANQLAHYLQSLGIKSEIKIGICINRSIEMLVGILGILKAGAAYVPLDPNYPPERLAYIVTDTAMPVIVTQKTLDIHLPIQSVSTVCLDSDWSLIANQSRNNPDIDVLPENLAYLIYTSGSTGKPKGVMISHRSLVNYIEAAVIEYNINSSDHLLQFASINFDTSAEEIYPGLITGATLVLRSDTMIDSVTSFLQKCQEWSITVLDLPTTYWHEITASLTAQETIFPSSVRLVIIGGERALAERLLVWRKRIERTELINSYGPTEATIVATIWKMPSERQTSDTLLEVPIGRAIRNTQVYILDRHLQPVPIGVIGELHISGAGLARGYLNLPEATAERFIPHPFSSEPGVRLYRTGDLARYRKNGDIEFVGRCDHQLKIRGFRIELGEIETALAEHPALQNVVVIAWEKEAGEKRLIAYVVAKAESEPTASDLRNFLKEKLPDYMLPTAFVFLDSLPLTASGKIDRRALPAPSWQNQTISYLAPRTPVEEIVAGIWCEVLKLERVGVADNFFELGGHSLLATQVIS
ncbi:MAG: amino acid adenylation domain-containing protein, partial [Acidobacteriota bacterium]